MVIGPFCNLRAVGVNLSRSRRSVPALHLFEGVQTETVRLHFDASASSASLKLTLMGRAPVRSGVARLKNRLVWERWRLTPIFHRPIQIVGSIFANWRVMSHFRQVHGAVGL